MSVEFEYEEEDDIVKFEATPPLAPDSDTERLLAEADAEASHPVTTSSKTLAHLRLIDRLAAKIRELQTAYLYANECAKRCQANGERDAARVEALEGQVRELRAELERVRAVPQTPAMRDVAAERERQQTAEGWLPYHDDEEHRNGELAKAGACYALSASGTWHSELSWLWPSRWQFKPKEPRRDLVRAAALLVAEIDRLDRANPLGVLATTPPTRSTPC